MHKNFYDYVQVKTLMRLQKSIAGGDEKLIINFMWPNNIRSVTEPINLTSVYSFNCGCVCNHFDPPMH